MTRNIEKFTYSGISKFPDMKYAFAAGIYKDVSEVKTDDTIYQVKPTTISVHRIPGHEKNFTIFRPVNKTGKNPGTADQASNSLFTPSAKEVIGEAADVADMAWAEQILAEGVCEEVIINPSEPVALKYARFGNKAYTDVDVLDPEPRKNHTLIKHESIGVEERAKIDKSEGIPESGTFKNFRDNMNA